MNRQIFVISGPTLSGKSWLLEQLLQGGFNGVSVVRMDDIRKQHWGEGKLTNAEGVYRNELTRNEIVRRFIIDGAECVLVEMPCLTREKHQYPLVEMRQRIEAYLQDMAEEKGEEKPKVVLRVVLLHAGLDTIKRRLEARNAGANTSNTDVFALDAYLRIAARYEYPHHHHYVPFVANTDEPDIVARVGTFFCQQDLTAEEDEEGRARFQADMAEATKEAKARGLTALLV